MRARVVLVLLALGAAVVASMLAPPDWPAGTGTTSLAYRGELVIDDTIAIGGSEPVALAGTSGSVDIVLEYPAGIPVDDIVAASIGVSGDGAAIRPELRDIDLRIGLPDGRSELVPVTRWDAEAQRLEARRRPTQESADVLALLAFVVVLWVSEAFPLFVTSLSIPVVLVISGVAGANAATSPFFNPIIVLFFAGFLMAEAMRRTGLDHFVSVSITARAGRSALTLFATMVGLTAFLSMWMSNTAAAAVLVPIAISVSDPLREERYQRVLILGIAYAATLGGVGSAIGTPANQLAIEFLGEFAGRTISFAGWFAYGLPMVVLFLPLLVWFLWRRERTAVDPAAFRHAQAVAEEERHRLGAPNRDQLVVLAVFAAVAAGWLTEVFHDVHAGLVALAGAVALFALGKLRPDDLGRISWPALITFGGGLTLGLFLVETGTSDFIATKLTGLAGAPLLLAVLVVALVTLMLTTVASNTASAAILIPLAIPLAAVLGVDPTTLVVVIAIASSIDFALVIGTPPTMIAYSTGLFTAGRIFRTGILLDFAGVAVLVFVVTRVWEWLGLI